MSVSLAPAPQDLPAKFDAAFGVALSRLQDRYAPIPYQRTCYFCRKPIFTADTSAHAVTDSYVPRVWVHSACENVNTGAEVDGSDATDDRERQTDQELNEHFLTIKGWQRSDLWLDPVSGLTYLMADALSIQNRREDELNG